MSASDRDYQIVSRNLLEEYLGRISGHFKDNVLLGEKPENIVLAGMIKAGAAELSMDANHVSVNEEKMFESVPAIGLAFRLKKPIGNEIILVPKGKLFYRTKPTYAEQCTYLLGQLSIQCKREFLDIGAALDYLHEQVRLGRLEMPKFRIMDKYRAISLDRAAIDMLVSFTSGLDQIRTRIDTSAAEMSRWATTIAAKDSVSIKSNEYSVEELFDEKKFTTILSAICEPVIPKWKIDLPVTVTESDTHVSIKITIVNSTPIQYENNQVFDTTLYDAGLMVRCLDNVLADIELNAFRHDYDDATTMKGSVDNASLRFDEETNVLETVNIPIYEQKRVFSTEAYNDHITFDHMINDPIRHLSVILSGMENQIKSLLTEQREYEQAGEKRETFLVRFRKEIALFEMEVKRFRQGIQLIRDRSDVRRSFDFMNRVFKSPMSARKKAYPGWRLFQIVFIVSELADIAYSEFNGDPTFECNNINHVDLLYFPTGGGKTEAFLGCSVFTMFFDRLREKTSGTSVMVKYPLRLLSVQQLDRVLDIIMRANLIKKSNIIPGDEFSVGYFVGGNNTPNDINDIVHKKMLSMDQQHFDEEYRVVDTCPVCGQQAIQSSFDEIDWRLKHRCTNCQVELPLLVVDDEIYRYLPTIILGTIDKLANIGLAPKYKALFGEIHGKCAVHGFGTKEKCKRCGKNMTPTVLKDPIPTLFIQDELHLVRDSLGTFASHYEGFQSYFAANLVGGTKKKIKYIGATATISAYDEHIMNLYLKNARCFPTSVRGTNFYSYAGETVSRYIVGFSIYGRSVTAGIQTAVTYMRELIHEFMSDQSLYEQAQKSGMTCGRDEYLEILNDYYITIVYNNSKNDSNELSAAFENQGNNTLAAIGLPPFNIDKITGDSDFQSIKKIMYDIEGEKDKKRTTNLILATSSISHGVDEECFNQIFIFGMPNNTAEYIQVNSRVGRKYPGLVFDIIRIARDRDRSYLKNFLLFHKYADKLIDPIPINRWAKQAIYSTLPGIFQALLIQYYGDECFMARAVKARIQSGELVEAEFATMVKNIYGCAMSPKAGLLYAEIIAEETSLLFTALANLTNLEMKTSEVIESSSKYRKAPMKSLRDIDVQLELEIKKARNAS